MASNSDEVSPSAIDEGDSPTTDNHLLLEKEIVDTQSSMITDEEEEKQEQSSISNPLESVNELQPHSTSSDQQENIIDSVPSQKISKEQIDYSMEDEQTKAAPLKSRSVNFSSTDDDINARESHVTNSDNTRSFSSYKSSRRPVDFIDTLVESYKLETGNHDSVIKDEKKYVPKTTRTRLNPNWREHRTRRLMNKLEELSLWDREEELKASQAQSLRELKWEQIQDRQRNHDLCLNLMRQRHESEMESAIVLDRAANNVNDENTSATIARAMKLASPANILAYDLPTPPSTLKRRVKQDEDNSSNLKTPIGRFRQFQNNMDDKVDKINQKLQPDREIMRAYSPYRASIPATVVPLFSETYSALLAAPDTCPSNKYDQYHYGVASYLHQPHRAPSPDYETRSRSYSNRDVRVPLKEQANDYSYYDDDSTQYYNRSTPIDDDQYTKYRSNLIDDDYYPSKYRSNISDDDHSSRYRSNVHDDDYSSKYRSNVHDEDYSSKYRSTPLDEDNYPKHRLTSSSRLNYSPPRRTTSLASPTASSLYDYSTVANTPREYSLLHSRQPTSNSIHQRSLNDDLNAITRFSTETTKKILHNLDDTSNGIITKSRSTLIPTGKRVTFNDQDDDDERLHSNNLSRNYSSKTMYQPVEILSLSSTR